MDYFLYRLRWAIKETHKERIACDGYWWTIVRALCSVVVVVVFLRIMGVQ